jgi:hypothetical protein
MRVPSKPRGTEGASPIEAETYVSSTAEILGGILEQASRSVAYGDSVGSHPAMDYIEVQVDKADLERIALLLSKPVPILSEDPAWVHGLAGGRTLCNLVPSAYLKCTDKASQTTCPWCLQARIGTPDACWTHDHLVMPDQYSCVHGRVVNGTIVAVSPA